MAFFDILFRDGSVCTRRSGKLPCKIYTQPNRRLLHKILKRQWPILWHLFFLARSIFLTVLQPGCSVHEFVMPMLTQSSFFRFFPYFTPAGDFPTLFGGFSFAKHVGQRKVQDEKFSSDPLWPNSPISLRSPYPFPNPPSNNFSILSWNWYVPASRSVDVEEKK